ncbi:MAG TPA: DNA-3-methyladenine glycosylase I [Bacteroidota bacterium]|nr:DNA-3-methyladenine glycosylase I [Bacteroidota bacterium]
MKSLKLRNRCPWGNSDPLYIVYHDREWGVPVHNDRKLFEFLMLEGMQAGLSWLTILRKRENFRKAFDNFEPRKVARYNGVKIRKLLRDKGIIRNKLKIRAAIQNAKTFLKVQKEFGSFDKYIWQFVDGKPKINRWKTLKTIPPKTKVSDTMSKNLKERGFQFVGSTICYAHMQATGMVNDHLTTCFRYREIAKP